MAINQANTRNLHRLARSPEAVTLRRRVNVTATTTYTDYSVSKAQHFPLDSAHEGPANTLPVQRCRWLLWASILDAGLIPAPRIGDLIRQADGTEWAIKSVQTKMMGNDYACTCVKNR